MMAHEGGVPGLIAFPDADARAARLAEIIAARLELAIARDGAALLALSGGSTPDRLHGALAAMDINWSRVTVIPVDERWVDLDHPGSNEAFIQRTLIDRGAPARLVGLKTDGVRPADGLDAAEARLQAIGRKPDAIIFGMGNDGHTASWFPEAEGLEAAIDSANGKALAAVTAHQSAVTGELVDRITLTLPWSLAAPLKILLMQGDAKRETYNTACGDGSPAGDVSEMPVRALLRAAPDLWPAWSS